MNDKYLRWLNEFLRMTRSIYEKKKEKIVFLLSCHWTPTRWWRRATFDVQKEVVENVKAEEERKLALFVGCVNRVALYKAML